MSVISSRMAARNATTFSRSGSGWLHRGELQRQQLQLPDQRLPTLRAGPPPTLADVVVPGLDGVNVHDPTPDPADRLTAVTIGAHLLVAGMS